MNYKTYVEKLKFSKLRNHGDGLSLELRFNDQVPELITPWMRVTANPQIYDAMTDKFNNAIPRVNVYTEVNDTEFKEFLKKLKEICQKQLETLNEKAEWNSSLIKDKFLRTKLHVRPNDDIQTLFFWEGQDTPEHVTIKNLYDHISQNATVRFILEIRPMYIKNGRCGITFKASEVECKRIKSTKTPTVIKLKRIDKFDRKCANTILKS